MRALVVISVLLVQPLLAHPLLVRPVHAQSATVLVRDANDFPIPYAVVSVSGQRERPTDASGMLRLTVPAGDSLRLTVRRVGYKPFSGMVLRSGAPGQFTVTLTRVAAVVDSVMVIAPRSTVLSRSGFYDRMERTERGAALGDFISPEELELRNPSRVSHLLSGRQYVRVSKGVLLGRGGCPMHIVIDRVHVTARGARNTKVDDLILANAVTAIEVYPSHTSAPPELQVLAPEVSCGMVVIWTGGRR